MKFVAIALLVCIAAVIADPIEFSHNTVGDIININLDANAVVSSNVEANLFSAILGLLSQQAAVVAPSGAVADAPADS